MVREGEQGSSEVEAPGRGSDWRAVQQEEQEKKEKERRTKQSQRNEKEQHTF